jgi:hypothetical protein
MHGDYSLNPFAYRDNVSRVLYQQGRVQLDSDLNELTESLVRASRMLAHDVIGPHGGVLESFQVTHGVDGFKLAAGQYWVDGIRCVNPPHTGGRCEFFDGDTFPSGPLLLTAQPWMFAPKKPDEKAERAAGLFYLDAFEHHLSPAQDDSLREAALMGADTTSRAIVVWQVKKLSEEQMARWTNIRDHLPAKEQLGICDPAQVALNLVLRSRARLRARATVAESNEACVISPDARYRGAENRLFRVEIHDTDTPTFKFSRDNGAEVYPIRELNGTVVQLESLGRDQRTAIRVNDWVEIVDDEVLLMNKALKLRQVVDVRRHDMTVILNAEPEEDAGTNPDLHPLLRRWAGPPRKLRTDKWMDVADGVQVEFLLPKGDGAGFRTGDYWLVPTRTATGDVIWPRQGKQPRALPPHGVEHHYAPLEEWLGTGQELTKYRKSFVPLTMQPTNP